MQHKHLLFFGLFFFTAECRAQQTDTLFLYFANGRHSLNVKQRAQLDSLAQVVKKNYGSGIRIYGFTDQTGSLPANKDLSEKRAETVKNYLVKNTPDLNPRLIENCRGMGPKLAVAGSVTDVSEARHRRVEVITITKSAAKDIAGVQQGKTMVINNLDFLPGRHQITPESEPALENLLSAMKQNPNLKIEIQGHICCQKGTDGLDEDTGKNELSANRARFVYNYLIRSGIEPSRLSYRGFGRTRPLADPELTEEDRQKNRRVEIQIISK